MSIAGRRYATPSEVYTLTGIYQITDSDAFRTWVYQYTAPFASVNRSWSRQSRPYINTLPYSSIKWSVSGGNSWVVVRGNYGYPDTTISGSPFYTIGKGPDSLTGWTDSSLLAQTQNACLDNIKAVSWDSAVFIAEFGKTSSMISSFAKGCSDTILDLKRRAKSPRALAAGIQQRWASLTSGRNPPELTGKISNAWLQWRYGVQTGVMDIEAAARTLADSLVGESEIKVVRASRTTSRQVSYVSYDGDILTPFFLYSGFRYDVSRNDTNQCKAWIRVRRKDTGLAELNKFGLVDLPGLFWELTWLSFVADWFLDIGSYLSRLSATIGYEIIDAGFSSLSSAEIEVDMQDWSTKSRSTDPLKVWHTTYSRTPWDNPSAVFTPGIRLNTSRIIDAAALLKQLGARNFKIL